MVFCHSDCHFGDSAALPNDTNTKGENSTKRFRITRAICVFFPSRLTTHTLSRALSFPLLQHFLYKLTDRRLVHPLGSVDKWIAIFITLRTPVALRYFVFRNIDAQ